MSAQTNNVKIGLFALFGVLLFVAALLVFGAWSNFEKGSLYETYVASDVSGLSVGSTVELRGVRVGKVTRIGFSWNEYQESSPDYVVVVFEMNDNISPLRPGKAREERLQSAVKRGLRARLKAQGVTGVSILSLEYVNPTENPPMNAPWTPNYTYIPSAPGLVSDLLGSMLKALHKLDRVDMVALDQATETDLKTAGRILGRLETVDMEGLSTNTAALLTEVRSSNTKLQTLLQHTDDTMKKLQLEKLTSDADGLVGQFQEMVTKLEPGLVNMDFDSLNQTLVDARHTMHDIDEVLHKLEQYPAGFIFGKAPPQFKVVQSPAKN